MAYCTGHLKAGKDIKPGNRIKNQKAVNIAVKKRRFA